MGSAENTLENLTPVSKRELHTIRSPNCRRLNFCLTNERTTKYPPASKAESTGDRIKRRLEAQAPYMLSSQWNCGILLLVAKMKDAKQKTTRSVHANICGLRN